MQNFNNQKIVSCVSGCLSDTQMVLQNLEGVIEMGTRHTPPTPVKRSESLDAFCAHRFVDVTLDHHTYRGIDHTNFLKEISNSDEDGENSADRHTTILA